jgi:hypothetical protein
MEISASLPIGKTRTALSVLAGEVTIAEPARRGEGQ